MCNVLLLFSVTLKHPKKPMQNLRIDAYAHLIIIISAKLFFKSDLGIICTLQKRKKEWPSRFSKLALEPVCHFSYAKSWHVWRCQTHFITEKMNEFRQ